MIQVDVGHCLLLDCPDGIWGGVSHGQAPPVCGGRLRVRCILKCLVTCLQLPEIAGSCPVTGPLAGLSRIVNTVIRRAELLSSGILRMTVSFTRETPFVHQRWKHTNIASS
jgi:hypothetical protein